MQHENKGECNTYEQLISFRGLFYSLYVKHDGCIHGKESKREAGVIIMECLLQRKLFSNESVFSESHLPQDSPDGLGEIMGDFFKHAELLHLKLRCLLNDERPSDVELSQPTSSVGSEKIQKRFILLYTSQRKNLNLFSKKKTFGMGI